MARVQLKSNYDNFNKMMNRFKKLVDKDNIVRTYCDKQYYEKPTTKRKKSRDMAVKRHSRKLRDEDRQLKELRLQSRK